MPLTVVLSRYAQGLRTARMQARVLLKPINGVLVHVHCEEGGRISCGTPSVCAAGRCAGTCAYDSCRMQTSHTEPPAESSSPC